jgi:hypothetical protein
MFNTPASFSMNKFNEYIFFDVRYCNRCGGKCFPIGPVEYQCMECRMTFLSNKNLFTSEEQYKYKKLSETL